MPQPVTPAEFAAAMDRLGPWDAARRIAVAVSGGPDSLALLVLAQGWGDPAAFIVDHGLRPESAAEASRTSDALTRRGVPARILTLTGLAAGPALAARARTARYAALAAACREAGLVDLLLGHHAGDQAETVLMRQRRASGPAGLSGMAVLWETDDVRLLRPLLAIPPERLHATVGAVALTPIDDPTNRDERWTRVRLRREIGGDRAALLAAAAAAGAARSDADRHLAAELASLASLFPDGHAVVAGPVSGAAFAALLRAISGRRYPLASATLRLGTKGGVQTQRRDDSWLLFREPASTAAALPAESGAVWDGRFRADAVPPGLHLGALGADAARLRDRSSLPAAALRALPALRQDGTLFSVPHLRYHSRSGLPEVRLRPACLPAAGAPFRAC